MYKNWCVLLPANQLPYTKGKVPREDSYSIPNAGPWADFLTEYRAWLSSGEAEIIIAELERVA